jgi:hypothetical protein
LCRSRCHDRRFLSACAGQRRFLRRVRTELRLFRAMSALLVVLCVLLTLDVSTPCDACCDALSPTAVLVGDRRE